MKTGWGTDLLEGLDNREQQLQDLAFLREKVVHASRDLGFKRRVLTAKFYN
ncbi:hypothetical protein O9992_28095 [Vibrio lentus]|nr:hypothetical protein [Vibrio lentus]